MVTVRPSLNGVDERHRWRRNVRLYPLFYFFHDLHFWMPVWIIFATDEVGLTFAQLGAIGPGVFMSSHRSGSRWPERWLTALGGYERSERR